VLSSPLAARLTYTIGRLVRRVEAKRSRRKFAADLLFCPFTAPFFHDPRTPTVSVVHDLQYKTYPQFFSEHDVAHRDAVFIDACRRSSAVIAISDYVRSTILANGPTKPDRVFTVLHRIPQRVLAVPRTDLERRLAKFGLDPDAYVFYPANFWRHKNHEMLLTAFAMAAKRLVRPDVKLVLTGAPGGRLEALKLAAEALGLRDRVVFPGYVDELDFASLIRGCLAVIFPSLYEGFGLPVIEAMNVGKPVACSNTTSLPEVAGDAALMFDPKNPTEIADALIKLIDDESFRNDLVKKGRERAMTFCDSARMASEYWSVFQYAVANARHETILTGAFEDGWMGRNLVLHYTRAETPREVAFDFRGPEWLPYEENRYVARDAQGLVLAEGKIERGSDVRLQLSVSPEAGFISIEMTRCFRPSQDGKSADGRELSAMLTLCSIAARGGIVQLYPVTGTADVQQR
jgi:glycosyltransferase involved in cell wall biosynthesis